MSSQAQMSPEARPPVIVVCAGNWLIAHDRIGPLVFERIQGRCGPDVEVVDCGSAGLKLLDCICRQELMIVVDACLLGGEPGEVKRLEPDLSVSSSANTSVHQVGPIETLAVASRLFPEELPLRTVMILVETAGIDGATIDTATADAVSAIDQEIEAWREQRTSACHPVQATAECGSDTPH